MKRDLENRDDIVALINSFYEKVRANPKIGFIFNDIAKVDWDKHLPIMYSFWASILFGERSYSGNPMNKHIALSKMAKMSEAEFAEWLLIFHQTVDSLFEGEKANEAKARATNIAGLMLHKIQQP